MLRVYRGDAATCATCPMAAHCLQKGRRTRTVERGPDDAVREAMAAQGRTPAGAARYRARKGIVEPVLGILQEGLGFRPFSRRGLAAATSACKRLALAYHIGSYPGAPRGRPRRPARPPALRRLLLTAASVAHREQRRHGDAGL